MANIVLISKCNLNCSYCFAKDYIKNANESFTITNFKKAVNFIKTSKDERIGLVGGEPFLHPDFDIMLNILKTDNDVKNVIIFTNGTCLGKYINTLQHDKFCLLINCNSPDEMGNKYNILRNNIKELKNANIKNFWLGINLYSNIKDYFYIFDLLKTADLHELRFSFSLSKEQKKSVKNILDFYRTIKPFWINFINECNKREIVAVCDCAPVPDCLLDDNDRNIIIKTMFLAGKYKASYLLYGLEPCPPLIDIFPDLTAVRSFCCSADCKIPISKFADLSMLREYFYNEIDIYNEMVFADKKCVNCIKRLTGKCRICPIFKTGKSRKLKQIIARNKF